MVIMGKCSGSDGVASSLQSPVDVQPYIPYLLTNVNDERVYKAYYIINDSIYLYLCRLKASGRHVQSRCSSFSFQLPFLSLKVPNKGDITFYVPLRNLKTRLTTSLWRGGHLDQCVTESVCGKLEV